MNAIAGMWIGLGIYFGLREVAFAIRTLAGG